MDTGSRNCLSIEIGCNGICKNGQQCRRTVFEKYCYQHTSQQVVPKICGICLDYITEPITFKCNHQFCTICVNKWVISCTVSPSCPMCRGELELVDVNRAINWAYNNKLIAKRRHVTIKISDLIFENQSDKFYVDILINQTVDQVVMNTYKDILTKSTNFAEIINKAKVRFVYYHIKNTNEFNKYYNNSCFKLY